MGTGQKPKRRRMKRYDNLGLKFKWFQKSRVQGWCQRCTHTVEDFKSGKDPYVHIIWIPGSSTIRLCTKHYVEFVRVLIKSLTMLKRAAEEKRGNK